MSLRLPRDDDPRTTRLICLTCVRDGPLRAQLKRAAHRGTCSYCDKTKPCVSIQTLAEAVEGPLQMFCAHGATVRRYSAHTDDTYWDQEGEELAALLQHEAELDAEAANDLSTYLEQHDPAWPPHGEEPFFERGALYVRTPAMYIGDGRYGQLWEGFATRITHERRFFDTQAAKQLADILGGPGSAKAVSLPVLEIGPETPYPTIFRARVATSEAQAREILTDPGHEVGPPPREKATVGRMNPAGISVFYGALGAHTAVAEVRPYVGGLVVVAQFTPTRCLRLLDLTQMGSGYTGSIFADDYADRVSRRQFLRGFHALIARPVRPGDEQTAYVPTQAVAEYVGNVLGFDGLLFASVQVGAVDASDDGEEGDAFPSPSLTQSATSLEKHNVVLFGEAGRVDYGGDIPLESVAADAAGPDTSKSGVTGALRYVSGKAQRVTVISFDYTEVDLDMAAPRNHVPSAGDAADDDDLLPF
jgi:hypothetical protein